GRTAQAALWVGMERWPPADLRQRQQRHPLPAAAMTARTSSPRTGQRVRRTLTLALGVVAASAAAAACSDDGHDGEGHDQPGPDVEPLFPEDYRDSYVEVRDCRGSGDHDLNQVRML